MDTNTLSKLLDLVPDVVSIDKKTRGEYAYIELDERTFARQYGAFSRVAYDRGEKEQLRSFIDVGCGIGAKLLAFAGLATYRSQRRVVGIDNTIEYVEAAKRYRDHLVKKGDDYLGRIEVYLADALEYDYADHDVVYFYRPISDSAKQQQLEERIHKTMKVGAYLLANLPEYGEGGTGMNYYQTRLKQMPNNFKMVWACYDQQSYVYRKERE